MWGGYLGFCRDTAPGVIIAGVGICCLFAVVFLMCYCLLLVCRSRDMWGGYLGFTGVGICGGGYLGFCRDTAPGVVREHAPRTKG